MSKLRDQERKMMEQIEDLGLVSHVTHTYYEPGTMIKGEHGSLEISHETTVELYNANAWNNVNKDRKDGKTDKFPRDLLLPVGIGFTRCSVKDQFNRKVGRVIATSRAIKSFLNSEASN